LTRNQCAQSSWIFLILVGAAAQAKAQSAIDPTDTGYQGWVGVQVAVPVTEKLDWVFWGGLRQGRDFTHPVYEHGGTSPVIQLGKHFTVSPIYQFIAVQPHPTIHNHENRFSFNGAFSFPLKKFIVSDTNQFDERLRHPNNSSRYRNRLQLELPFRIGAPQYRVFVADEVSYDWNVDKWSRNRSCLGAGKRLRQNLAVDLFFMKQNGTISFPRDVTAIGATVRLKVDRPLHHLP
jgi:hypothetical protein